MQVGNRNPMVRREKGWLRALIMVISWLIIVSLARDVWQIRIGFGRISESQKRLMAEEAKNSSLKQKLELVATEEYKEKLIREKLNMQKAGEVLVVMPKRTDMGVKIQTLENNGEQNWEKWWKLLRG